MNLLQIDRNQRTTTTKTATRQDVRKSGVFFFGFSKQRIFLKRNVAPLHSTPTRSLRSNAIKRRCKHSARLHIPHQLLLLFYSPSHSTNHLALLHHTHTQITRITNTSTRISVFRVHTHTHTHASCTCARVSPGESFCTSLLWLPSFTSLELL